ncbi:GGDEF domain-containing phosphodiesterase [Metasolibacillus sp.]|uniref:GGDEF domain-containing phosphodiesterase n=1 Tax=Metasolibacillus sp. TaxID=2703680 RepID=UPI0025D405DB|nr:GGDEF domain-containing phosphodiesterase [Metasolibacillus sp.]MCT6925231.1 EAL domain-containing protein [Metasolibacillus sp.]MCT6941411.1 EAL domain-containing protein [Metasolibacillus sp.]
MKDLQRYKVDKELLNQAQFPSFIISQYGCLLHWTSACEDLFGYTAKDFSSHSAIFNEQLFSVAPSHIHETILNSNGALKLDSLQLLTKHDQLLEMTLMTTPCQFGEQQGMQITCIPMKSIRTFQDDGDTLIHLKNSIMSYFMVVTLDYEGLITQCNDLFLKTSHWTPKRVIGKSFWQLFPKSPTGVQASEEIWETLQRGEVWKGEVEKITKDGMLYWTDLLAIPVPGNRSFLLIEKDITNEKTIQLQLEKIAYIDTETGFMNVHRLEHLIDEMIQEDRRFSFVYISIDKFYTLKDLTEFNAAKNLAADFAKRIKIYFQDSTVARIDASDFVIITPLPEWFIQGFLSYLQQNPIYNEHTAVPLSISGSITRFPEDQLTFGQMMKASTLTITNVRKAGGNSIMSLSKEGHKALSRQATIEKHLLLALDQKNLNVLYQPQLDIQTGKIIAAEALVRWVDENIGVVSPDELIPIAEETGLIHSIGSFVLEQACQQALAWQKEGIPLKVSINVSIREFRDKNMARSILETLERTKCPADLIQIEITEKFALEAESEGAIMKQMRQLEQEGIVFVLDDFGTGYASFRYMQLLPLKTVKIDATFIRSMMQSEKTEQLVRGMIQLAKSMQLTILAEGVETAEQFDLLKGFGCDLAQGYHICKPTAANAVKNLYYQKA